MNETVSAVKQTPLGDDTESAIEIRNVSKSFGELKALDNVSVSIRRGEFFGILGPSGCGKTTLLRIIGGFEFPDSGEVFICGENSSGIPAHRRPLHTVFQSYALFPHLNVRDNIGFGLKMRGVEKGELHSRVEKIMQSTQIDQFADRRPAQLSGGQQQRVALARAIVNEPEVLLLDEPLGALDLKLRKELQVELMLMQRRLKIAFILVTHDQEEALTMCHRIAVMNKGKIEQLGDVETLYERPRTRFVSTFLGSSNLFEVTVRERNSHSLVVESPWGALSLDLPNELPQAASREKFTVALRPEKISLTEAPSGLATNMIPCKVKELLYIGSETHYTLETSGPQLFAEAMNVKVGSQGFDLGEKAFAQVPPGALVVLED